MTSVAQAILKIKSNSTLNKIFKFIPFLPKVAGFFFSPSGQTLVGFLLAQRKSVSILFLLGNLVAISVSVRTLLIVGLLQVISGATDASSIDIPFRDQISDLSILSGLSGRNQDLAILISAMIVLTFVSLYFEYLNRRGAVRLSMQFTRGLRERTLSHAFELDTAYFSEHKLGEISHNLFSPVGAITQILMSSNQVMMITLRIIGVTVVIFYLAPVLSLTMSIAGLLLLMLLTKVHDRLKPIANKTRDLDEKSSGILSDIILGMRLIKQAGQEANMQDKYATVTRAADNQRIQYVDVQAWSDVVVYIGGVVTIMVIAAGVAVLYETRLISDMGFALGYFMALWRLFNESRLGMATFMEMLSFVPYLRNLTKFLQDKSNVERSIFGEGLGKEFVPCKELVVKDVNFSYDEGRQVLRDINLRFPVGTVTAVVGLSGSGKTTLLELIGRIRQIQSGVITVDDIPLSEYDLVEYRRSIGYVNQDSFVFNDTIKNNISFIKQSAADEEIEHAARRAQAHEFISQSKYGYDTPVGERGTKISGGQRQRLVLARCLLQRPKLLLLDEATSALDAQCERAIMGEINDMKANSIVIMSSHRLTSLTNVDHIIFMHNGEVIEQGTHEELIAMQGMYCSLYAFQSGAMKHGLEVD